MDILVLDKDDNRFMGWVQEDGTYKFFKFEEDKVEIVTEMPVSNYKDYETFALVIGKFVPHMFMLKEPIKIDGLTKEELERVYKLMPKLTVE